MLHSGVIVISPLYSIGAVGGHDAPGPEEVDGCPEKSLGIGPGLDVCHVDVQAHVEGSCQEFARPLTHWLEREGVSERKRKCNDSRTL